MNVPKRMRAIVLVSFGLLGVTVVPVLLVNRTSGQAERLPSPLCDADLRRIFGSGSENSKCHHDTVSHECESSARPCWSCVDWPSGDPAPSFTCPTEDKEYENTPIISSDEDGPKNFKFRANVQTDCYTVVKCETRATATFELCLGVNDCCIATAQERSCQFCYPETDLRMGYAWSHPCLDP